MFSDGKKSSIEGIMMIFKEFAEMSGMTISLEKSTLFMAGVEDEDRVQIMDQFPFAAGTLPVRYLGLPLLTKRMTVQDYSPLIQRIKQRISSWTARKLSFAGRLQLISSVIHSLINFWMSAFRLPKQCIKEIDQLCCAFLWSGPDLSSHKAKIAWKDVCKPREEGGLGLRSLNEVNSVCCLKLIWRVLSAKESLWVCWIHRYLIRKGSLWSVNEGSYLGSWIWKNLLKFRPLASMLTRMEIGNGSYTSFWFDNWSPLGRLIDLTGSRGCITMGIPINTTVEAVVQIYRRRRHRVEVLVQIEKEILNLRTRGLSLEDDTRLWKTEAGNFQSCFSTKQTWEIIRSQSPRVTWSKWVWFRGMTPKFSFITWLAIQDRLATGTGSKNGTHKLTLCVCCARAPWNQEITYSSPAHILKPSGMVL